MKLDLATIVVASCLLSLALAAAPYAAEPSADLPQVTVCEVPLLPLPEGVRRVNVKNADELARAVAAARDGDVILLADGTYRVGRPLVLDKVKNVSLRSAAGDAARVVLRGRGFDAVDHGDDILRISACEGVTVAHLTFGDCHAYALKVEAENSPKNVQIHGCRFLNIGTRGIKGSTAERTIAAGGSIRHCHFENDRIPPADWQHGGNYITAIDMMSLEDWTISDNTFVNIKGRTGIARAAIFVWVRSRRVTIERNRITGCDRGIALGNPSGSSNDQGDLLHVYDSICRNNFIVPGPDAGIELAWVRGVKVYHNTVWREDDSGRGIRAIERIHDTDIANNLIRGRLLLSGAETETARANHVGPMDDWFIDPKTGDLRLKSPVAEAIDQGVALPEIKDDITGRRRDDKPDLGAWEFKP